MDYIHIIKNIQFERMFLIQKEENEKYSQPEKEGIPRS